MGSNEKMMKVARLYFKSTGEGMTQIPKTILSNDGVATIRNLDRDMEVPRSCMAAFGAVTDKTKVPDDMYDADATPYEYAGWGTAKSWIPMGAFTMNEYKTRIGKDWNGGKNRIGQALKKAREMGEPMGIDIFDVPESAILYGDDQQVIFDNNVVGWKPKQTKK